jgi:ribonuclease H / adenosylcobalamin/alpha-ribazole phosphatase
MLAPGGLALLPVSTYVPRNKASAILLEGRNEKRLVPIHLLRHGAHQDVGQRLPGRASDGGLTDAGRAQAMAAAVDLDASPPTAIYASPRRRTMETAKIVAERFGLGVTCADALDEIDFGEWTGARFADLAGDPRWTAWNSNRAAARSPGGESQTEAQVRALAFAFEAAARSENPLFVTHCDIIRALHCWAERRSLDDIHDITCEPGSLSTLELIEVVA